MISEIFKNEFLPQEQELDKERVIQIVKLFDKEEIFTLKGEEIQPNKIKRGKLNFFINLMQAIVDSYLVVVSTIYELASQ